MDNYVISGEVQGIQHDLCVYQGLDEWFCRRCAFEVKVKEAARALKNIVFTSTRLLNTSAAFGFGPWNGSGYHWKYEPKYYHRVTTHGQDIFVYHRDVVKEYASFQNPELSFHEVLDVV